LLHQPRRKISPHAQAWGLNTRGGWGTSKGTPGSVRKRKTGPSRKLPNRIKAVKKDQTIHHTESGARKASAAIDEVRCHRRLGAYLRIGSNGRSTQAGKTRNKVNLSPKQLCKGGGVTRGGVTKRFGTQPMGDGAGKGLRKNLGNVSSCGHWAYARQVTGRGTAARGRTPTPQNGKWIKGAKHKKKTRPTREG